MTIHPDRVGRLEHHCRCRNPQLWHVSVSGPTELHVVMVLVSSPSLQMIEIERMKDNKHVH